MSGEYHPIGTSFDLGRSIGNGFAAVRVALGPMWLGGLLMLISDGGCSGSDIPTNFDWPFGEDGEASFHRLGALGAAFAQREVRSEYLGILAGVVAAVFVLVMVVAILMFALNAWVTTGFIRMHVNVLEHASDDVHPLFTGKDRFWHMAGYKLLSGFGISAAVIAAAWPGALVAYAGHVLDRTTWIAGGLGFAALMAVPVGAFVGVSMYLGEHAVVLEQATPVHALRRAWALARGNRWPLVGFVLVMWLVQFVSVFGIILCCIGLLATMPLAIALTGYAKTESFVLFTRGREPDEGWALWRRRATDIETADRVPTGGGPAGPPASGSPGGVM